jgi:hypothetical protein
MANSSFPVPESRLDNVNVERMTEIPSPAEIHARLPLSPVAADTVF